MTRSGWRSALVQMTTEEDPGPAPARAVATERPMSPYDDQPDEEERHAATQGGTTPTSG